MLKNPIDQDRIKLFPKKDHAEYMAQAEGGMNDAELIDGLRRNGSLKRLDPNDYPLPSASAKTMPSEFEEGYGFKQGDIVRVPMFWPWKVEYKTLAVRSVLDGGLRLSDGRVYPLKQVQHA